MKRYWFTLMNEAYVELEVSIPDGSSKTAAVKQAKRWMQANGVKSAWLEINSMQTENILDTIEITL